MSVSPELPPLQPMDVPGRLTRLREALAERGADAMVVTNPSNIRWLTGFTGSNGRLVVTGDALVAITDGRYRQQIEYELESARIEAKVEITSSHPGTILDRELATGQRVALEADHVTWKRYRLFETWLPGRELLATDGVIQELRKEKDPGELSRLVRAAALADLALSEVRPMFGERPTEQEVARRLDSIMVSAGADEPSYDTIVASGPNGALPHARPSTRTIEPEDLVIIDVGARLDGYGSDMTRTFVAGGEPSPEQRRLYDAVIESQAAGVAAVRAGAEIRAIDAVCRNVLAGHGLADAFIHSTGHGIGLEIHEDPILSARTDGILRAGFVVTVEPGVYLPALGGVRIEDSVIVNDTGCEPITHSPKSVVP